MLDITIAFTLEKPLLGVHPLKNKKMHTKNQPTSELILFRDLILLKNNIPTQKLNS